VALEQGGETSRTSSASSAPRRRRASRRLAWAVSCTRSAR
jgi:hypothetical protein